MKTKTKKLLSILLALMMFVSVVPFYASAAELIMPQITEIPTATEIANAGDRIRTSTLSGGKAIDPTTGDVIDGTFKWKSSGTKVNESGYYDVTFRPTDIDTYDLAYCLVFVRITGDDTEVTLVTTIVEAPTIESTITTGTRLSDYPLIGGKATNGDGVELSGTFSYEKDITYNQIGTRTITVVFTPDDDRYAKATANIKITIEPGPIKFVDENGNTIVPEITIPYGTKAKDLEPKLKTIATNCSETLHYYISAEDDYILPVGTHTLEVLIVPSKTVGVTPNYLDTTLTFKVTVEPREFSVSSVFYSASGEYIIIKVDYPKAPGTYDVYVDGTLAGSGFIGTYGIECPWKPETSGTHTVKVVYNPAENDPCVMADYETEIVANVARNITVEGLSSTMEVNGSKYYGVIANGDEITLECSFDVFAGWEIKDAQGNEVDLGVDLAAKSITFTMPDYDLVITAKSSIEEEKPDDNTDGDDGFNIDDIFGDLGNLTEGDGNVLENIINNLVAFIKNIIETIKGFFRGIGDMT